MADFTEQDLFHLSLGLPVTTQENFDKLIAGCRHSLKLETELAEAKEKLSFAEATIRDLSTDPVRVARDALRERDEARAERDALRGFVKDLAAADKAIAELRDTTPKTEEGGK